MLSHSLVSNPATLGTVTSQVPLSMGILQARTLEWVAMSSSRGSSQPRDQTQASCPGGILPPAAAWPGAAVSPLGIGWTPGLEKPPSSLCCALSLGPRAGLLEPAISRAPLSIPTCPLPQVGASSQHLAAGQGVGSGAGCCRPPSLPGSSPTSPPLVNSQKLPQLHTAQPPLLPCSWPCHPQFWVHPR